MVFSSIITTSLLLFSINAQYSRSQECQVCSPRNFTLDIKNCVCPAKEFCNKSGGKCENCGECFNIWDRKLQSSKDEVESLLRQLSEKYEINLDELKKTVTLLTKKVGKQENDTRKLDDISNKIANDSTSVFNTILRLRKELENIAKKLREISIPKPGEVPDGLQEIKNKVEQLKQKLQDTKVTPVNDTDFDSLVDRLKKISEAVSRIEKEFPKVYNHTLNLALQSEKDLDLLHAIIDRENSHNSTFPANIKAAIYFIEKSLLSLFNILNNLPPELSNNALLLAPELKKQANETKSRLHELLAEEKKLEATLKQIEEEVELYRTIKSLQERLGAIIAALDEFERLLNNWKELMDLDQELDKYKEELQKFQRKIEVIEKNRELMDTLLKDKFELVRKASEIIGGKSIREVGKDVEDMIREVEKITEEVDNHCRSTTP